MSIPWPKGLAVNPRNMKAYGEAVDRLNVCTCSYYETIKHIDKRGVKHNKNCPLS